MDQHDKDNAQTEELITQIKERARNLYLNRELLCAEAVLVTLNQGLNGGLSESQAIAMAAPFNIALGESGCLCGSLSGAVLACGLFLGNGRPYRNRRSMRACACQMHNHFKEANNSTCCRVLCKKVEHDKEAHFQQCADLTAETAGMAARLILRERPELISQADNEYLAKRRSKIGAAFSRLFRFLSQ